MPSILLILFRTAIVVVAVHRRAAGCWLGGRLVGPLYI